MLRSLTMLNNTLSKTIHFLTKLRPLHRILSLVFIALTVNSCDIQQERSISFYHWKSKALHTPKIEQTIQSNSDSTIYLRYFDIDQVNESPQSDSTGEYPVYVLTDVDLFYKTFNIVPVIFIANKVFQSDIEVSELSQKIEELVDQISRHHFGRLFNSIQVDCDWTESTRNDYFELISELSNRFDVSVTLRLHQIKYPNQTGIPPVDRGVLMLYNMGELSDTARNSIIDPEIVAMYVGNNTNYPIPLDVALPLFSQTVIRNNDGHIRLMNHSERDMLDKHGDYFSKIAPNRYQVIADTFCKGFYLSQGYTLEVEELSEGEVVEAFQKLESSQLDLRNIIFYHLDDRVLNSINVEKIIIEL